MKIKNLKLKIIGMHCSSCAFDIDGTLEDTQGVKSAKTSYAKQECEIEFEEDVVGVEQIITQIKKSGYKAQVLKGL